MKKFFIFSLLCLFTAFGFVPAALAQGDCIITTLPYTEDFESGNIGSCYHINPLALMPNGNIYPQIVASSSVYAPSHSGTYHIMSYNYLYGDTAAQVPCLIFPELSANYDVTSMVLDFWAWVNSANGYFVVGVMDDPTDMSTFTPVQTIIPTNTNSTYEKYTAYFTNYAGTGHYIALKLAVSAYCMIRVDDITLDQAALCSPVQNLAVQSIVGSEVTINWAPNAQGGTSVYTVTLENLTTGQQDLYTSTVDTFYTFTNLDYSTDYRAFVTVVCLDNQESAPDSVDFSTLVQSVDLPYFEDFEGDAATALAPFTFSGTGPNQWVYGFAAGMPDPDALPGDTMHAIYISPDSGATNIYTNTVSDAYAVFNVTFPSGETEYHLAFDYRVVGEASDYSEFDYMKVYMLNSDATIPATGAPSGVALLYHLGEVANVSDWTHFDIILNNVAGASKQIVFYWYNNGWNLYGDSHLAAAVDNIAIIGIDCAAPSQLSASDIDTESATVSWHENGSASAWTVYYKVAGSTGAYMQEQVTGDTNVTLYNLTANTEYEFYVVADCGESVSYNSEISSFHTACSQITTFPYAVDFETGIYSTSQQNFITCWSRLTSDPDHYAYIGSGDYYAHGGNHFLDFHYTPNCYDIAIMPELGSEVNASDLMITFYACHTNYGYNTLGTLEIGVMTDNTDDSTFVVVDTIDISTLSVYTYAQRIVSLANYTGNGKYIAFRVSNCNSCGYYIDDILLEQLPPCMYPNNFSVTAVANDSITLAWTEMGSANAWIIQYDTDDFTPGQGANTVNVGSNPFTVTGLSNLTPYYFYVQADCGDAQSDWIGPVSAITGVLNMGVTGSDTLTTCSAIICDNGGSTDDYSSYCDYTVVLYPATAGSGLQITGTANLHPGNNFGESHLYFYEGAGTNGALISDYTGLNLNIAVASSGPVTVRFTSNYYTAGGFVLNVSCTECAPPAGVTVSDLTSDGATVSWNGSSDQYAIYLSGAATGYYTTSSNSFVLSNLTPNSTYSVQLRSLCSTDSSLLSPVFTFTTPCDAITITQDNPWTENFESYTGSGNTPFQCWARPVVDAIYGAPFVYCGHAPSCHSGANSAELKGSNEMLVLPLFSNDVHDLRLSFWATSTAPLTGTLEIGVLPNVLDPSSFELVDVCGTPGPRGTDSTANGNYMGPFDFSGVTATNGRIALRYSNASSYESWNLDDFVVELAPGCSAPADVTVSAVTTSTATVTWTASASEWKLQYKAASTSDWGTEYTVTNPTYDLVNLVPSTAYQVRVKAVCDSTTESAWSAAVNFTTESAVVITEPTVQTNAASGITQTTVTLNGEITDPGNQGIIARGFEWKLDSESNFTQATTGTSNVLVFTISGLTPNTCGTFRAFATTANTTTYGETLSFCTLPQGSEPCDVPTGLHTTNVENEAIAVAWDANAGVDSWNVRYRLQNGEWASATANTNSYNITGLTGLNTYEIQVQADCGDGNVSDWSGSITATTTNVGIDEWLSNSVTLFPNPANDVVNVQCTMNNVQGVEVFDVFGKVIRTVGLPQCDSPTTCINVSDLADGMYFVRVTTDRGAVTKTFVKK